MDRRALAAALLALPLAPARAAPALQATAPDFTLRSTDQRNLRLHEQRGQVVLVDFWASWCGPCRQELPQLDRLDQKYRAAGFLLLAVNIDDDPRAAAASAARWGVRATVLLDTDKAVSRLYDLGSLPAGVLIDRDGRVRQLYRGYVEGAETRVEREVRALLKE